MAAFTHNETYGRLTVDVAPYELDPKAKAITADFYVDGASVEITSGAVTIGEIRTARRAFTDAVKNAKYTGAIVSTIASAHGEKAAKALGFAIVGDHAVALAIAGKITTPNAAVAASLARTYA